MTKIFSDPFYKNKKGQSQEIVLLGVILLVLGITILIGFRLLTDINDQFQSNDFFSETGKSGIGDFTSKFPIIFDSIYAIAVVLLAIIVIISVFLIDTHPIFLAFSIPALMGSLFVNVILANALDDIGKTGPLISLYDQLPIMQFVAGHWLQILAVIGFAAIIALYSKRLTS